MVPHATRERASKEAVLCFASPLLQQAPQQSLLLGSWGQILVASSLPPWHLLALLAPGPEETHATVPRLDCLPDKMSLRWVAARGRGDPLVMTAGHGMLTHCRPDHLTTSAGGEGPAREFPGCRLVYLQQALGEGSGVRHAGKARSPAPQRGRGGLPASQGPSGLPPTFSLSFPFVPAKPPLSQTAKRQESRCLPRGSFCLSRPGLNTEAVPGVLPEI